MEIIFSSSQNTSSDITKSYSRVIPCTSYSQVVSANTVSLNLFFSFLLVQYKCLNSLLCLCPKVEPDQNN